MIEEEKKKKPEPEPPQKEPKPPPQKNKPEPDSPEKKVEQGQSFTHLRTEKPKMEEAFDSLARIKAIKESKPRPLFENPFVAQPGGR
jgi:hypothetical protein